MVREKRQDGLMKSMTRKMTQKIGKRRARTLKNAKIIVSTTFNESHRVNSIFKNINPDGFLIKNDVVCLNRKAWSECA